MTDALGRFEFLDVPPTDVFIRFNGHGSGTSYDLSPTELCRDLCIELARTGEFRFEAAVPARAPGAVSVLDEAGERLSLEDASEAEAGSSRELEVPPSGICRARVSELARWLVLLDDGHELTRLPLTIRHGRETRVRW